ncbi:UDPglucose 6-dehydrogenase [Methanohalophilus levihalophilus]|uniref:UDP-glucose dehydrogenase family protein n=1 Tax=Methanohalophilus levihalophilus TaxID=1431282 RepID=UPI001AEB82A8|nr:UDP-glucose/GDP-mannose dehydrogenase family protein [Methanohalophilus levihalophilus]MBP2030557.1 UDPglucose 6-dehydrogenase [Methanohalophilus levihalophilus]
MRISIIGSGYVGSVTAACFAALGHEVICIDIDEKKVSQINDGYPPVWEEGLEDLMQKHVGKNLIATSDYEYAVQNTDISFICVGTPSGNDGGIDLSIVGAASKSLGSAIASKSGYHVVVVKSTVVPGTTEDVVLPLIEEYSGRIAGEGFGVAMNPEFLREGRAVDDFMNPDKIVVGAIDERSGALVSELYRDVDCEITYTNPKTAEMIKYTNNSLLATKISFANEIGNICKKLGIDTYEVMNAVGKDFRLSPNFLNSGAGFGGSCFPKDVRALIGKAKEMDYYPSLLESVMEVNELQPLQMVELLQEKIPDLSGKTISVLGLAFKGNTDDIRESRSIPVIKKLLELGAEVKTYDPLASENMENVFDTITYCESSVESLRDADACLIMTEWDEFRDLDEAFSLMKGNLVIDGRHLIDPEALSTEIEYVGICW